ncbi:chaplin [Spirillospora sp. NBC_00431]
MGFVALGVSAIPANAFADTTDGTGSVLGGNQVSAPVSAPVDVSGNGASLLGTSYAISQGGAKVHERGEGGGRTTSGVGGVASGNQVDAPVSAPVNVCGNAVGVLGHADAGCDGGAKVKDGGTSGQVTDGTGGVIAGNQVNAPISVPVNVCGNAVAVVGAAMAGCDGGSLVKNGGDTGSGQETSGLFGVVSGNQATLPVSAPVDVCGNAVGNATAFCEGGASVRNGGHRTGEQITDGTFGVIAGNQANAPISVPVNVCGNAAAVIGQAGAFCEGGVHVRSSSGGDQHTSGIGGVLSGNQGNAPVTAPADVCGNAAAVIGFATALCEGGTAPDDDPYPHQDPYPHHRTADAALPTNPQGLGSLKPEALSPGPQIQGALSQGSQVQGALGQGPAVQGALSQGSLSQGSAVLPKVVGLDGVRPVDAKHRGNGSPGVVTIPNAGLLKSGDLVKATPGAGMVPGGEGAPVAVSLLGTRNLPGDGTLPVANGQRPAKGGPAGGGLSETSGVLEGLPKTDGLQKGLGLPKTKGAPKTGRQSPATVLPVKDTGLLKPNALPNGLPATENLLTKGGPVKVKGLPAADGLSSAPALSGVGGHAAKGSQRDGGVALLDAGSLQAAHGIQGPKALLPVPQSIPGVPGGDVLPVKPVVPQLTTMTQGLPAAAGSVEGGAVAEAVPVAGELGAVEPVAAEEAITDGAGAGTMWTAIAGMLAAAGAFAVARRLRPGRR